MSQETTNLLEGKVGEGYITTNESGVCFLISDFDIDFYNFFIVEEGKGFYIEAVPENIILGYN